MLRILPEDDWSLVACVALGALLGVYVIRQLIKWRRRQRRIMELLAARQFPKCPKCGYDLHASPDYCPECGQRVDDIDGTIIRYMMRLERYK